jgi:hypothetical protein
LLLDGRVLCAGGQTDFDVILRSTEIYDPAKQTFTSSGNMTTTRSQHTATLLPDGMVLIVGGDGAAGSAELYDPSNGTFTATGSLLMAREGFNATLLANGKVLITGGVARSTEFGEVVADAELYDPSTKVFTPAGTYAGSLAKPAIAISGFASTSALLPDGTVLFATEPSAQIYDPASFTFRLTDAMFVSTPFGTFQPDYIDGQTATLLLNGKILIAGGEQEDLGRFNSAELFDAASNLFVPTGSMLKARHEHTATLLPDGTVLMAGGQSQMCDMKMYCYFSGTESSADLYDPVKGAFTDAGNMTAPRDWHTATLLNSGNVLLAGGEAWGGIANYSGTTASAELYHPASPSSPPALGAIWHAAGGQLVSPNLPAGAGEILSMYVSGLAQGAAIPPQVAVGDRLAEILFFGDAPGYPGYFQVNFRVPVSVVPGPSVPVHLNYLSRASNEVTIGVQ